MCIYVIVLDETTQRAQPQSVVFGGYTKKASYGFEILLKEKTFEQILVLSINRKDLTHVKHVREFLKTITDDEEVKKQIEEYWIFTLEVQCKDPNCCTVRLLSKFIKYFEKHEPAKQLIVDFTTSTNIFTKFCVALALEILRHLYGIDYRLYDFDRRSHSLILREFDTKVVSFTKDPLESSIKILELVLRCSETAPSDRHSITLLMGKLERIRESLGELAFDVALSELESLNSLVSLTSRRVEDPNVVEIVQHLPITQYLPKGNEIEKLRKFVRFLKESNRLDLALRYLLIKIVVILFSYCCYFGKLSRDLCRIDTISKILDDPSITEVLRIFDNELISSAIHLMKLFSKFHIARPYCKSLCFDDLSNIGKVVCEGFIPGEEVSKILDGLLLQLETLPYYETCEKLQAVLDRLYKSR